MAITFPQLVVESSNPGPGTATQQNAGTSNPDGTWDFAGRRWWNASDPLVNESPNTDTGQSLIQVARMDPYRNATYIARMLGIRDAGDLEIKETEAGPWENQAAREFSRWFEQQGYRVGNMYVGSNSIHQVFDAQNRPVGDYTVTTGEGAAWDIATSLLIGAATAGIGGAYGWGPVTTGAVSGAAQGGITSAGSPQAAFRGAVGGGLGGAVSAYNPGGRLGLGAVGGNAVNSAIRGAIGAGSRGGNIAQGAVTGAVGGGVNAGAQQIFGNDAFGRSLATILAGTAANRFGQRRR